jgi:hypothetical protein
MTIDEILFDLGNKVFYRAATLQELTKVEQMDLENDCTELLKKLVAAVNKRCLRNFSLTLEMDVNEDDDIEILGGR